MDSIRSLAQNFGSIKLFKAYLEVSEHASASRALLLRSELQSSGVSLTDCPHNGRKDVADKMIIGASPLSAHPSYRNNFLVDMLAHAIDNPAPSTIVLVSGDRDFAYALSILRLRRYHIVLITLTNAHPTLKAQASHCFDWISDVLGPVDPSLWHQPNSPHRGKVSVPSVHDKFYSGHNASGSPVQESFNQKFPTVVELINYFQYKARCRENCLTPPQHDARPNLLSPGSKPVQPATSSVASSVLHKRPESRAIPICSPVASSCHTDLSRSSTETEAPFIMTPHDSNSSQTITPTPDMSARNTPKPEPYGNIMASKFSAHVSLRGSPSLPNIAQSEVANVAKPASFESSMQTCTLSAEPDLRRSSPLFQQQDANVKVSGLLGVDAVDGDPYSQSVHSSLSPPPNITSPAPSFVSPSSLSHPVVPTVLQSPVEAPTPLQPLSFPAVPVKFKILVRCLKSYRSKGNTRPLRSNVALEIACNGTTYRQAGVKKFCDYAAMAEEAGIIELGGWQGTAWIALKEPWYNAFLS